MDYKSPQLKAQFKLFLSECVSQLVHMSASQFLPYFSSLQTYVSTNFEPEPIKEPTQVSNPEPTERSAIKPLVQNSKDRKHHARAKSLTSIKHSDPQSTVKVNEEIQGANNESKKCGDCRGKHREDRLKKALAVHLMYTRLTKACWRWTREHPSASGWCRTHSWRNWRHGWHALQRTQRHQWRFGFKQFHLGTQDCVRRANQVH